MASQINTSEISLSDRVRENEIQIARLQGGREHLATKADIAMLEAKLDSKIEKLRADLTWRILLAMGVLMGLVMAFIEWRVVSG